MMRNKYFIYLFSVTMIFLVSYSFNAQENKIGDVRDGSRSKAIHNIKLLDENNRIILKDDDPQLPFSTKYTCGDCHSYEIIKNGYHFNLPEDKSSFDRNGEPWIYLDFKNLTVLPVSYRGWNGTFSPERLKMSPMAFLKLFGTHFPGGKISEDESIENPENFMRWEVSGKLPVNCLMCHDASEKFNSSEYALNMIKQNYKWATAAGSDIAEVSGSAKSMPDNFDIYNSNTFADVDLRTSPPPSVKYKESIFSNNKVFFNIKREVPNDRCYFCHSSAYADKSANKLFDYEEDVHLKSGLKCVDCHGNGLNHDMIRGFENESRMKNDSEIKSFTCRGCHLRSNEELNASNGNLGAPVPEHLGLPPVHLEKLSCTTCHSGKLPDESAGYVKTSRAHKLGVPGINKSANVFPHIQSTVYIKNEDGKIEPNRLIWPSYWARLKENNLEPLSINELSDSLSVILKTDSLANYDEWPSIQKNNLVKALLYLNKKTKKGTQIVFVSGEKFISLGEKNKLKISGHDQIKPYAWAFAHDVRPAGQSLGAKSCQDCHSWNSNFFFGRIPVETPYSILNSSKKMNEYEGAGMVYNKLFSLSFFFRPLLKIIIILSCVILFAVVFVFFAKGILFLAGYSSNSSENQS